MRTFAIFLIVLFFAGTMAQASVISNPGGGSGTFVSKTGDTMTGDLEFLSATKGVVFLASNGCRWRTGVDTTGTLTTTLLSCPATGSLLMEDGTFILTEGSAFILTE